MPDLPTMAETIVSAADGQPIEAIVLGVFGDGWAITDPTAAGAAGRVLTWDEASPLLDYPFPVGHGNTGCHPVWAWTADRVLYVREYDSSVTVQTVPRNPAALDPHFQ